jgi:aminoglycoside 6'-N-acetyltransferase I
MGSWKEERSMWIVNLVDRDETSRKAVAKLLIEGFTTSWQIPEEASAEVEESLVEGRISRVACDESGAILGWIGGFSSYDGNVWELHPLVVATAHQRKGIGRALVSDFEDQARARGGITVWLGSDDEDGRTSLSGRNLYPDVWKQIAGIRNLRDHPYEFYQKVGYVIVGVVPDANGPGKPDILMAKSLLPASTDLLHGLRSPRT